MNPQAEGSGQAQPLPPLGDLTDVHAEMVQAEPGGTLAPTLGDLMNRTPVTPSGLRKYDRLPPAEAAKRAWRDAGSNPAYHRRMKAEVARSMPLLARALDRLIELD